MDAPFNDVLINRKSLQELKDTLKEILLLVKTKVPYINGIVCFHFSVLIHIKNYENLQIINTN
jgi:hypothetical protein